MCKSINSQVLTVTNAINSFIPVDRLIDSLDGLYECCDITGDMYPTNELTSIQYYISRRDRSESARVCQTALEELTACDDCGCYTESSDSVYVGGRHYVCPECYNEGYFTCNECGDIHADHYYAQDGICVNCYRDDNNETQFEHVDLTYTRKVFADLDGQKSNYAYGIGLEIEAYGDYDDESSFQGDEDNFAEALKTATQESIAESGNGWKFGHTYPIHYKDDSSLRHEETLETRASFEANLMPMRIETCRKVWSNPEVLKAYDQLVKRTTDRCGLHISISADHDGLEYQIYSRINYWLMPALEASEEKARKILGRKPSAYHNNKVVSKYGIFINWRRGGEKTGPLALRGKTEAHLTGQPRQLVRGVDKGRMEFRAFRAPMQPDLILRRIEYAVSMVEWSKLPIPGLFTMTPAGALEHFEQFHEARTSQLTK